MTMNSKDKWPTNTNKEMEFAFRLFAIFLRASQGKDDAWLVSSTVYVEIVNKHPIYWDKKQKVETMLS